MKNSNNNKINNKQTNGANNKAPSTSNTKNCGRGGKCSKSSTPKDCK